MGILEMILLGIGLSMDAFAVTICNIMAYKGTSRMKALSMPVFFGFFQGLMPFIGYYAGSLFGNFMNKYSGLIIFAILGFIGGKMVYEGIKSKGEACDIRPLTLKVLFLQSIATSIDAFAVGIALKAVDALIINASIIIALTTFLCTFIALFIGKSFGSLLKNKADILGGIILIVIGVKGLF